MSACGSKRYYLQSACAVNAWKHSEGSHDAYRVQCTSFFSWCSPDRSFQSARLRGVIHYGTTRLPDVSAGRGVEVGVLGCAFAGGVGWIFAKANRAPGSPRHHFSFCAHILRIRMQFYSVCARIPSSPDPVSSCRSSIRQGSTPYGRVDAPLAS